MFTKKSIGLSSPCSVTFVTQKDETFMRNDQVVTRNSFDEVDALDSDNFPELPSVEEYTLTNLLNAGVPLSEVPVFGLLDSDASDLDMINAIHDSIENSKTEK